MHERFLQIDKSYGLGGKLINMIIFILSGPNKALQSPGTFKGKKVKNAGRLFNVVEIENSNSKIIFTGHLFS